MQPTCSVDGCDRPAHARLLCTIHGPRHRRHGDPLAGRRPNAVGSAEERFWSFVERHDDPDACWLWNGGLFVVGYAQFSFGGRSVYGHRWIYEHMVGPIPESLTIDHVCHNRDLDCPGGKCLHRTCVNPAHLEPVTTQENFRRGRERRQRAAFGR